MKVSRSIASFGVAAAVGLAGSGRTVAQEPEERAWRNSADLSLVLTSGNSETMNVALSDKFTYRWSDSEVVVDASALRTETTRRRLSNENGTVSVEEVQSTTAEAYSLGGRFRHTIRKGFSWYTGAAWERNRLKGIDDRATLDAGLGYRFFAAEPQRLRAELGASVTYENRVGGAETSFAGARAFLGYEHAVSETSRLTSELEVLENVETVEDWRAKSVTAVTASLTSAVALKLSYTVTYDHQPVVVAVTDPTGASPDAFFTFEKTDQTVGASVVINF